MSGASTANVKTLDLLVASIKIGYTGRSGNASQNSAAEAHLHFEIRTMVELPKGMTGRIDPATLYGRAPMGLTIIESHGQKLAKTSGTGFKISAADMKRW